MAVKGVLKENSIVRGDALYVDAVFKQGRITGYAGMIAGDLVGDLSINLRLKGRYPIEGPTGKTEMMTHIADPLYMRGAIHFSKGKVQVILYNVTHVGYMSDGVDWVLKGFSRNYEARWGTKPSKKIEGILRDLLEGYFKFASSRNAAIIG